VEPASISGTVLGKCSKIRDRVKVEIETAIACPSEE
jgi:hypothetical protein